MMLLTLLLSSCMGTICLAKGFGHTQELFPDGTPIPGWFLDSHVLPLDSLGTRYDIRDFGVVSSTTIVQTERIQAAIDMAASKGGGVVYIPVGTYKSGALHFKQGTHLYLERGALLLGSEDIMDFPLTMTRIEGQYCKYFPALINIEGVDGFTLSGEGVIDGNGTPYWKAFRLRRQWNPQCTNKDEMRPRLVYVANSCNVTISGVTLQNSPYWTSHYYKSHHIKLLNLRIFSPSYPVKSASADGIDIDACSSILIKGCQITTNDDGICFKGGKGPEADKDETNGGNENILVEDCFFDHTTGSCMTCGSEAIHVRNVLMRNCRVDGEYEVLLMKMRPDTPQCYEYITVENMTGKCKSMFGVSSWKQFFDLKGHTSIPKSYGRNVLFRNMNLECKKFMEVQKRENEYELSDFSMENITINAIDADWDETAINRLQMDGVSVNGKKVK